MLICIIMDNSLSGLTLFGDHYFYIQAKKAQWDPDDSRAFIGVHLNRYVSRLFGNGWLHYWCCNLELLLGETGLDLLNNDVFGE